MMTYGRLCLCPVYRLSQTLKTPFLKPSIRTPLTVNRQTRLQFPHVLRAFAKRVFHPTPPFATLLGFHLFAHPFGNYRQPLWFWHLFLPQLLNFVLTVHVFNLPIFMARVPLPPLIIAQPSSLCLRLLFCL
jgi:hypothetical protein